MCRDRDKRSLFRGWSRLCLNLASVSPTSTAGGSSVAAAADARATQKEVSQIEAVIASDKAQVSHQTVEAAAVNDRVVEGNARAHSDTAAAGDTVEEANMVLSRRGVRCAGRLVREAESAEQACLCSVLDSHVFKRCILVLAFYLHAAPSAVETDAIVIHRVIVVYDFDFMPTRCTCSAFECIVVLY